MEEYSKLIAVYYGIDSQEVFENSRKDVLFKARSFVYFVLVFMYDVKKSVIARITGWDHATILYGIEHVVWMYNNLDDYHDFMNQVIGNEKMKQYINEIKNRKRKKVS
jgi:chromosomal replication initiation ATPase DnaA